MSDRDCANCGNRSDRGCEVWECEFKPVLSQSKQKIIDELDKIRSEIEQGYCTVNNDYDHGCNYGLYIATQIIDKYKSESEE